MQYNTSESQSKATVSEAVESYITAGWPPIPVLPNEKKPMLSGCTGNIPALTDDETRALWAEVEGEEVNVGIRLPETVIVLDVDEYQTKHGADTLAALEEKYGALPATLTNTRRGADSRSRHYFFRVPAGIKWVSTLGDGIEILQATHRFAVVSPSEKDGQVYYWYQGDGSAYEDIPRVDDPVIAVLPPAWIEPLKKDSLKPVNRPDERFIGTSAAEDSVQWIEGVTLGYDAPMGAVFTKMLTGDKLDELKAELSNNGHDTMLGKQRWAIRLAALDGHDGLKAALDALEGLFVDEVTTPGRSGRRSESCAREEWTEGLIGEVNALRGDHETGAVRLYVEKMPVALDGVKLTSLNGAREVGNAVEEHEKAIRRVVLGASAHVVGVAGLIALLCPELVTVRVRGGDDIVRDDSSRAVLTSGVLRRILGGTVAPVVQRLVQGLEEDTAEHTIASGTKKEVSKLIGASNLSALIDLVANAVADTGRVLEAEKLDRDPWLIGVGDDVLDLREAMRNPGGALTDWIRPRSYDDAVTRSAPVDVEAGLASLSHRENGPVAHRKTHTETLLEAIFPDAEDRRFAQKALGYSMSGNNKMHKFFVWFGPGGGGKGSLSESVIATLGKEYVSEMTPQSFIKGSGSRPDPDYAMSLGTRLSFVNETDEGQKIDAAAIKRATEVRKGRALYSNAVVESDANTVTVMTNRPFEFKHDTAVERRLAVIPFNASRESIRTAQPPVMENWRDRDEEKVYMLLWLVEGFCLAMNEGMETEDYPPNIAEATVRFIEAADPSQAFFRKLERTGDPEDFLATEDLAEKLREVTGETQAEATQRSLQMRVGRWFKDQGHENDAAQVDKKRGYRGWRLNEGTVLHLPTMTLAEETEEAS
jgi:phage/plasmid-associated DNA primase